MIVSAFMLAILLAGCGDPNRSKIIGIWEIESADSIASRLIKTESESSNNNDSRMSVEFSSNGVLKTRTSMGSVQREKTGSWEWLSYDKDSTTIRLKCTLGMQVVEQEIELIDPDTISMVPPNMAGVEMKLRFRRAGK